jgi:serine/threonine protein kinase
VKLYGVALKPSPRMVLEFLACGDLYRFMHPDPDQPNIKISPEKFPWHLRLRIALDVAKGMYTLHSHEPPIVHRDLRSPNIFVRFFTHPQKKFI